MRHTGNLDLGRPLKVAHVVAELGAGGAGVTVVAEALAEAQSAIGIDARVVPLIPVPNGPRTHWTGKQSTLTGFSQVQRVVQELTDWSPDVLHQHGLWIAPSLVSLGFRNSQVLRIISPHGMLDSWALRRSVLKKRIAMLLFERRNLATADGIHALSESERIDVVATGRRQGIAVVPNGVTLPDCSPELGGGGPVGRQRLLFLGRVHQKKGVMETLRAWSELRRIAPHVYHGWILTCAGWDDGDHLKEVQELIRSEGLEQDVELPGPVFGARKEELLRCSSAFILASHSEGLPMAVLEAWSWGLPCLLTRECNVPEGFSAGAAVEIKRDPLALAQSLAATLTRPDLKEMGQRGRELVRRQFSWPAAAEGHKMHYISLMSRTTLPAGKV